MAISVGHDQTGGFAFGRSDGAEDIGRFGALIMRRARAGSLACPTPDDLVFLDRRKSEAAKSSRKAIAEPLVNLQYDLPSLIQSFDPLGIIK